MRPLTLVLGAVVAVVSLGVAFLLYSRYGDADLRAGVRTFTVESDTLVRVQFDVVKDPATAALCTVRARGADGGEVATALVRIEPSPQSRQVITRELATTARAVSGEVTGCSPTTVTG